MPSGVFLTDISFIAKKDKPPEPVKVPAECYIHMGVYVLFAVLEAFKAAESSYGIFHGASA